MSERINDTAHRDAPLSAAYHPDATAAGVHAEAHDDELTGRTVTINRPVDEVRASIQDPDSQLGRFAGRLEIREAPAGRGTEVSITFAQEHRSLVGKAVDLVTGHDPALEVRRELRRLKQLLEAGEIATAEPGPAAPRGA
jgi:hypothetical protein